MKTEKRTLQQIQEQYEIEKELANRLRNAARNERKYLYRELYDEFFRRVPHHPQLTRKKDTKSQLVHVSEQMRFLKRFLNPETIFLEIGPGDCSLSLEVARRVRKIYAIDVSKEIIPDIITPENFELIISDGSSISVPENSINIGYSNQLMEHLHPDDAFDQLQNIYKALTPSGIYCCITPNRISGPHDISKYFDEVATGFHLKEYTVTELYNLFKSVGFSKINIYIGGKGIYIRFSLLIIIHIEKILSTIPVSLRKKITTTLPFKALLGICMVGQK
ncbi:methyltransferase domain-containing protein [candidate division WOR-3 bacterium]|nr:methyltransferase domain-containing protein [candidate division WOR-3 bacterium]